ncbi:MAG: hypothetical protein ACPLPT_02850 [Moorellales bacterium]
MRTLFWAVVEWLSQRFDWALVAVMVAGGAWSFWLEGPSLAGRGFGAEARLAVWGGLAMMLGSVLLWLLLQILGTFRPL